MANGFGGTAIGATLATGAVFNRGGGGATLTGVTSGGDTSATFAGADVIVGGGVVT